MDEDGPMPAESESMSHKLTPAERSTLRRQLEERRKVLRAELTAKLNAQDNPALLGLRNRMEETDDWAVADLETALDVAEVSRDAGELREVEGALTRMQSGTYGDCEECGQPIPYARLAVSPSAPRCIACQERLEATLRRGPPTL
jgi:DnaK suppressor protein